MRRTGELPCEASPAIMLPGEQLNVCFIGRWNVCAAGNSLTAWCHALFEKLAWLQPMPLGQCLMHAVSCS